ILYNGQKKIVNPEAQPGYDLLISEPGTAVTKNNGNRNNTPVGGIVPLTTATIDIFAVSDTQFRNAYASPLTEISNMISQVNSAFSPAEVTLNLRAYQADSGLTNTAAPGLLSDFRNA